MKSERLWRLLALLRSRGKMGATTLECAREARSCNASTTISELRRKGYSISGKQERVTEDGAKVWRYWLEE